MGIHAGNKKRLPGRGNRWLPACLCAGALIAALVGGRDARAATPQSPEVRKLVESALSYLENHGDERLGAKCLIGLTFLKANRGDHPRIREAIEACQEQIRANPPDTALDMYSNGLAVIFLCELSPQTYSSEIEWYLGRLKTRQKTNGGWGYDQYTTGDTSQTQYGALAYWEAHRRGFRIDGTSVENLADWLTKTQGSDGCWGYQGQVSTTGKPVPQLETNCSMLAAGLGCIYICADLFDAKADVQASESSSGAASSLPAALRRVEESTENRAVKKISPQRIKTSQLVDTMNRAHEWMDENYQIDIGPKRYYYLYGLERYKSFQEEFDQSFEDEPKWYNEGYEFLAADQKGDGSWIGYCGAECDTAFSVLFLLRSTQKSLGAKLGEGTLLGGRGLPTNLSRAKLRNGLLIVEQMHTKVDSLLSMIEDDEEGVLDELARDPTQLVVDEVDQQSARRLQQLVRGGEPEVRLLAVRALGRTGELDYVPSLLYALTDPDRQIVLEARDGLQFISRNFEGFGPPDDFNEQQRFEALDSWKKWYKSLRPTAVLD